MWSTFKSTGVKKKSTYIIQNTVNSTNIAYVVFINEHVNVKCRRKKKQYEAKEKQN